MKAKLILIICLLGVYSCEEPDRVDEPKIQRAASCKINIISECQLLKDSELCFTLVPTLNYFKIVKAYVGCGKKNIREYDTTRKQIKSCENTLLLEDDSVKIYIEHHNTGRFRFEDITLLLQDDKSNFYFIDTTFYYEVKDIK